MASIPAERDTLPKSTPATKPKIAPTIKPVVRDIFAPQPKAWHF
jgi:hypothetical protein